MASSTFYAALIKKKIKSNVNATDISGKYNFSTRFSDDLQMIRKRRNRARDIKLCYSPNLNYLNLLDYEGKQGNFHSSIFGGISVKGKQNTFEKAFETFEEFISASIFCFYIKHLRNIPKDSRDLQAFDQRIYRVVENLKHFDSPLLYAIFIEIFSLDDASPTEKILLPIILKNLCTTEILVTYAFECYFTNCEASFFKEVLDEYIKSRFDFWTMWERNQNLNAMHFCPVTYAYFQEKFDFLRVLLDYGFHHTHQREQTLKILLNVLTRLDDFRWLQRCLFKDGQSSREAVIDEVFLFIYAFLGSSTRPEILMKCFQLAWTARKEPYVTKQELLESLKNRFSRNLTMSEIQVFEERFDTLQTLLPDHKGLEAQPRTLQHLCRCTVREALNDNWQMPHGVAKLPLPGSMKLYILLR